MTVEIHTSTCPGADKASECLCVADAQAKQEGTEDGHLGFRTETHIHRPSQRPSGLSSVINQTPVSYHIYSSVALHPNHAVNRACLQICSFDLNYLFRAVIFSHYTGSKQSLLCFLHYRASYELYRQKKNKSSQSENTGKGVVFEVRGASEFSGDR